MKKNISRSMSVLALLSIIFITSCNKNDDTVTSNSTPEGTWSGEGKYGTSPGSATYVMSINFKSNGMADISGDNGTGPDLATGTWLLAGDSVKVAYRYAGSSADYTLAGRFTPGATSMSGTIGLGTTTTGVGLFTVTRQ